MSTQQLRPKYPSGIEADERSKFNKGLDTDGVLNTGLIEHAPGAEMAVPNDSSGDETAFPSAIRYNPETDEFEGGYGDDTWRQLGGGGIRWEQADKNVIVHVAKTARGYLIDNRLAQSQIIFPVVTRVGVTVSVADQFGQFATRPLTIKASGRKIYGQTDDMTISTNNVSATFTWSGDEQGWIITSGVGLGQGQVYNRTIFSEVLLAPTTFIELNHSTEMVDLYIGGARLAETRYTLTDTGILFKEEYPAGVEVQVIEYKPIQLTISDEDSRLTALENQVQALKDGPIIWRYTATGGETTLNPGTGFTRCDLEINGIGWDPEDYQIVDSKIILSEPLGVDPITNQGDRVKVTIGFDNEVGFEGYVSKVELKDEDGATMVGTSLVSNLDDVISGKVLQWDVGAKVTSPHQIVQYMGASYQYIGYFPHSIVGNSPSLDGGIWTNSNITGVWVRLEPQSKLGATTDLRSEEPAYNNQRVETQSYFPNFNAGGGVFYYDQTDTTSPDDGIFTIVTAKGKRWKLVTENGINAFQGGYNPITDNMDVCLNNIINIIVAKVVASATLANVMTKILISPKLGGGSYVMASTVKVPTFITLYHEGTVSYDFSSKDQIGFEINNTFAGLTNNLLTGFVPSQTGGNKTITSSSGKIYIKGIGLATATQGGIQLGNTAPGYLNCRDVVVDSCVVFGFIAGVRQRSRDTYINMFKNCQLTKNRHALLADDTTAGNSGEKTTFEKCIFSETSSHGVLINCSAMDYDFVSCNFDYIEGNVISYAASGSYGDISVFGGHVEGFNGGLVTQSLQIAGAGPNRVNFIGTKFDTRTATNNTIWANRSLRQIFSANSPIYINFVNCALPFQRTNVTEYGTLISHVDGNTQNNARISIVNGQSNIPQFLTSYTNAVNEYRFSGTEGVDITSSGDTATSISVIASSGGSVKYGPTGSDGLTTLSITMNSATDVVTLVHNHKLYVQYLDTIYGMISVRPDASSGNVNVTTRIRAFSEPTVNLTTGKLIETLLGSSADTTVNIRNYFTDGAVPESQFIATAPIPCRGYSRVSDYQKPSISFSGFTGTIQVKLPAWWIKN